ncbi:alpha/beta hydrolase family protein [Kocuria sp.]|uniref:alpha/beta hydrolase family protein n=1 Tax=Kocuria sp. TaxID=1871328 RepID=UPI0026E02578|nr:alpha/beta fold hydrolase [Kocuria sp.]MDO5619349.1 prolyl oligopeptidase family serine peptidase [Kocuria sp.]
MTQGRFPRRSAGCAAGAAPTKATPSGWKRGAVVGAAAMAGTASLSFGLTSAVAAYLARQVVVPPRYRSEDLSIIRYTPAAPPEDGAGLLPGAGEVTLAATVETTVDGVYSLRFDAGAGHARIGAITSWSPADSEVVRTVEEVYSGDLSAASKGWWSGTVFPDPAHAGYAFEDVEIPIEVGLAPAWVVPADGQVTPHGQRPRMIAGPWAIMVHGRGAQRMEGLRAVAVAQELGLTSMLISYRNDREAPSSADRRYGLGFTEWKDVQVAISYAKSRGATQIVLFGWSMGGAICMATADQSFYRDDIAAMVLTGPVVDWFTLFTHHTANRKLPQGIGRLASQLISSRRGRHLTGLAAPVDLASLDWVSRYRELRTPTLILHSKDDEFVPYTAGRQLSRLSPLVDFVAFRKARHTKEWNVDSQRWDNAVRPWLAARLQGTT